MKPAYDTANPIIKTRIGCITELVRELSIRRNTKDCK